MICSVGNLNACYIVTESIFTIYVKDDYAREVANTIITMLHSFDFVVSNDVIDRRDTVTAV